MPERLAAQIPGLAIFAASDAFGVDANDHALDFGSRVGTAVVAHGEMVDVVVRAVERGIGEATLDLGPAEHIFGIYQHERGARVALEVFEPVAIGSAVEPDLPVAELEP